MYQRNKIKRLKSLITEAETNLAAAKELLLSPQEDQIWSQLLVKAFQAKVLEGVFDGQNMVGSDGKNLSCTS